MIVKHRRGTTQEWQELNLHIIPEAGELVIEECADGTSRCKIGTGFTRFSELPYIDGKIKTELLAEIATVKEYLKNRINNLNESFLVELSTIEKELEAINNSYTDLTNDYITRDASLKSSISKDLADAVALLKGDIASAVNYAKETQASLQTEISRIDNELNTVEESLNNKLLEETGRVNSEFARVEAKIDTAVGELNTKLEVETDSLNNKFSEFSTATRATLTELEEKITSNKATVDETIAEVNQSLLENVENLRSATNLNFIEVRTSVGNLVTDIQELDTKTSNKFIEVEEAIKANNEADEIALAEVAEQITDINEHIVNTDALVAENTRRINNIIAPEDSEVTLDEEVIDIRIGYNGVDHASAGDAVRAIGNDLEALKASLPEYIPSNAVDGLYYENNQLWLTSKDELVGDPVTITGGSGGGGSISTVKVTNNLPSVAFTVAKGNNTLINFTYTSFENEVPTGDGVYTITINDKNIEALSGNILHGVAKIINVTEYLKNGSNKVKVTCSDQYGSSRSLIYTISVIELRIESTFNSAQIFNDVITFRYKVFGQIEKTALILVDGTEVSNKTLSASVSGNEITLLIPKQSHGSHKITAYVTATIDENPVESNVLEYEIICIESDTNEAILTSVYKLTEATQGDLISIPFMIYDPVTVNTTVDLIIYAQVAGELTEINRNTVIANREQQLWNTRNYPVGTAVFAISYTYNLYGVQTTITKMHTVKVEAMEVDVAAEEDSLQLYLTAQGRSNNEQNPAVWEFTQAPDGDKTYDKVTTTFEGFNWKSNGWITDTAGDTCLRLNGDAKATVNFKPFEKDFKTNGKTIEFEFIVRDVRRLKRF